MWLKISTELKINCYLLSWLRLKGHFLRPSSIGLFWRRFPLLLSNWKSKISNYTELYTWRTIIILLIWLTHWPVSAWQGFIMIVTLGESLLAMLQVSAYLCWIFSKKTNQQSFSKLTEKYLDLFNDNDIQLFQG